MSFRHCYCRPGAASCGTCQTCGRQGHTSHAPPPVPSTGSWCDPCYVREAERLGGLPAHSLCSLCGGAHPTAHHRCSACGAAGSHLGRYCPNAAE